VQRGPTGNTFVYVVKKDKTVELRDVKIGHPIGDERVRYPADPQGDYTAVSGGLNEGEPVVTDGIDKLQQGTVVQATQEKRQPRRPTTRPTTRPAAAAGATTRPVQMRTGGRVGRPAGGRK
ncbi:MAG TPA: hypothetical protein VN541_09005, partial [Tepidisphaeraceae bacterium]|nr:hypothetical protein [Tepidisphaeraceae bacterium]